MFSDKLGQIGGIKGRVTVELFNAETKEREFMVEKDNAILMAQISDILLSTVYISIVASALREYWQFNTQYEQISSNMPLTRGLFSSIVLLGDSTDVDSFTEKDYINLNDINGYATFNVNYSGIDTKRGTLNLAESTVDAINNKVRLVVDWPTNAANGSFQSVSLAFGRDSRLAPMPLIVPARDCNENLSAGSNIGLSRAFCSELHDLLISFYTSNANNLIVLDLQENIQTKYTLKKSDGTDMYVYTVLGVVGDFVYIYDYNFIRKYRISTLTTITANIPEVTLAQIPPELGYDNSLVVSDTEAWCKPSNGAIDSVTGLPYNRYLYKFNPSTSAILDRILVPSILFEMCTATVPASSFDGFHLLGVNASGNLVFKINNSNYPWFGAINPATEEFSLEYAQSLQTSAYSPAYFLRHGVVHFYSTNYYYPTNVDSSITLYKLLPVPGKHSRVALPAPVTKLNTQTLKVTYDIVFPDGII